MGLVLRPSAATAPWRVEVHPEWSCLTLGCEAAPFVARRHGGTVAITIRLDLAPALSTAIEELSERAALATVGDVAAAAWSARQEGNEIVLTGPGRAYMVDASNAECGLARTIEIEHGHLADLRRALTGVISSPRSPGFPMSHL
ncbi:hypothetical protein [Pseudonocardia alaniniphila]|uniref:Uncharacterized protein n=1 Tax=Pseudonocardia alaniniphila TaxID=75291 RepID=A0ABS9TSH2_9PSEU|nr:hypothetical protein [Pseudonocardia alaniniphila]MCH6171308.1 hypothetical protein [Pseudonocardia alaniniphila]